MSKKPKEGGAMSKVGKALEHMNGRAGSGKKKPHARHTGKKDCPCPDCRR